MMAASGSRLKKVALGWMFLVVLAPIGWLLPVLPGNLFFLTGLVLLSTEYHWAHSTVQWLRRKFPGATSALEVAAIRARNHGFRGRPNQECGGICCATEQGAD
jgi:hypothetical protein